MCSKFNFPSDAFFALSPPLLDRSLSSLAGNREALLIALPLMESNDDRARLFFLLHGVTEETIRPKKEVLLSILSSESSSSEEGAAGRFLPNVADAEVIEASPLPAALVGREERCAAETVPGVRI